MKFTCEKSVIIKEISIAQEIISSRNTLSILSNVLLETDNDKLIIKATDLKVSFISTIPVNVEISGSTTVFCDKFLGILRSLPDGEIEFSQIKDDHLLINPVGKDINFSLKIISSEKYPEIQETNRESFFNVPQKEFINMISQTIFSISDDETRYFMNGVYFEKKDDNLVMVATDGRRLSYISNSANDEIEELKGVIIPPKILNLVKKLSSSEGNISIAVSDKTFFTQFDNQKISSTLIEGQFPNYSRVIPDSQQHSVKLKKTDLIEALKRVSLLAEQKSRRIYMTIKDGILEFNSEESEIGKAVEKINCEYTGEETTLALNYLYLLDPLKVMQVEYICIDFTEKNRAITLKSDPEDNYFHIIMPMQMD